MRDVSPPPAERRLAWSALVVVMFCVPLFVGLRGTDYEEDEAIYSYAVDRLLDTGDWLNPRSSPHDDAVFLEKPPLKFWIVAAPMAAGLLPHDELGMRFWDALFGAIAFLYVFAIGTRTAGPWCGFIAVLLLFGYRPLLFEHGLRGNNMEAPLVLSYAAGVYHFLAWSAAEAPSRRRGHVIAIAAWFLLGFLTKFVAALFLPLVLLVPLLTLRDVRARFRRDLRVWLFTAVGFLLVAAPWFVYQHAKAGAGFWQIILGEHVYKRFTASLDPSHVHAWNYYYRTISGQLRGLGAGWLAAIGMLLLAVRAGRGQETIAVTLLSWILLPLALMSLGTSKLHHYAYPFLPPLAVAGAAAARWIAATGTGVLDRVMGAARERFPAWGGAGRLRRALLGLSFAAGCIALATLAFGRVNLRVDGMTLFRNSDVYRPLVVAVVFAAAAGRPKLALTVLIAAPALVAYGRTLDGLTVQRHPLRTMRECLTGVNRAAERQDAAPGVYVAESERSLFHTYFYYLRSVGPLVRGSGVDEAAIAERVSGGNPGPVLIARESHAALAARRQELASVPRASIGPLLVLLPGPYGRCAEPTGK